MSPAEQVVLQHVAISLTDFTPEQLADRAAEYAALPPGEITDGLRHLIDEESEFRLATRRPTLTGGAR